MPKDMENLPDKEQIIEQVVEREQEKKEEKLRAKGRIGAYLFASLLTFFLFGLTWEETDKGFRPKAEPPTYSWFLLVPIGSALGVPIDSALIGKFFSK